MVSESVNDMLINKKEVNRFLPISIFFHYEGDFIKIPVGRGGLQYDTSICLHV